MAAILHLRLFAGGQFKKVLWRHPHWFLRRDEAISLRIVPIPTVEYIAVAIKCRSNMQRVSGLHVVASGYLRRTMSYGRNDLYFLYPGPIEHLPNS